jgi:hypothetical protein
MSAREEFWDLVCSYSSHLYVVLVFVTAMAVLNLLAILLGPQSEGAFVVSIGVFGILGVTGSGVSCLLWQCNRR